MIVRVTFAAALVLVGLGCSGPAPGIDLSGMEPPVRELIESRQAALNASPGAGTWGELGDALLAHGLHPEATDCYARAIAVGGDEFEWLYLQGLATGADEQALTLLERAAALRPDDAVVELRISLLLQELGRYEEALAAFEQVLSHDRTLQRAHRGLGQVSLALGYGETAIESLEWAVAVADEDAAGWSALAQAYVLAGRDVEARAAAQRAKRGRKVSGFRDPVWQKHIVDTGVSSSRRFQRALQALADDDTPSARRHVEAILEQRSDEADAHYLMGLIEARNGNDAEARHRFERALKFDPAHGRSLLELAALAEREGRLGDALEWNERARELTPHDPSIVLALARIRHRAGDVDGVVRALEELVELEPDNVSHQLDLGDLYLHQERWARAAECFREALRLNPGLTEAQERLQTALAKTDGLRPGI